MYAENGSTCNLEMWQVKMRIICDIHLHNVFHHYKAALALKIASAKIRIKWTGHREPTMNDLFTYYVADHNNKAIRLFDVASIKAVNSMSIHKVLSATLHYYGKCRNDAVALSRRHVSNPLLIKLEFFPPSTTSMLQPME